MFDQNLLIGLVVLAVVALAIYSYAPRLRVLLSGIGLEGFADAKMVPGAKAPNKILKAPNAHNGGTGATDANKQGMQDSAAPHVVGKKVPAAAGKEGFADFASVGGDNMGSVPMAAAHKPQGCYPREQINPSELLPGDSNTQWALANPPVQGDLQGKNFLSAGALIGINTIGQSLRNANLQLRAEPPCPQTQVSPWQNSTIEPDLMRRPLE